MRKLAWILLLLMTFGLSTSLAYSAGVVKFGVPEIRSGPFKPVGDRLIWGLEAAVKEANDEGGLLGKRIELVIEDNEMNPEIAVQKVEKLVVEDGCEVIIQGSSSKVGLAVAQVMPRYKKIWLDVAAMAIAITGEHFTPYTFRTCTNAAMLAKSLAQYFREKKVKKFFLVNQNYSWGHDMAKYFEKFIKEMVPDAQILGKEFHKVFNEDFSPIIRTIKASDADYIITGNWGADLIQLILQSRASGMNLPFGCCTLDDDSIMSEVREKAVGSVTASLYILGVDNPRARAMEETVYKLTVGKQMAWTTMFSYIGTKMFMEAVKKAGTFETDALIKAFEGLTWEGPVGAITMRSEDHQAQFPMVLGEVVEKTKYHPFPYPKPIAIIPADQVSISLEECGWKPWKQ
jgi:branched-chain amino acid transport system substrate-binding protein